MGPLRRHPLRTRQDGVERLAARAGIRHRLAGGGGSAVLEEVPPAELDGIDADLGGDAIEVAFEGEGDLRHAEAAEGAVGRRVGLHHPAGDAQVVAGVGSRGVQHGARQNDGGERAVGAAVEQHVDLHAEDPSLAIERRPVGDAGGMALGRRRHVLGAVVEQAHRPAAGLREQRRVTGDHARELLLAAETTAGRGLHDAHALARLAEEARERRHDVERTLHRAAHLADAAARRVRRKGDDAVVLDVGLLLMAAAVGPGDDVVGERKGAHQLALVDLVLLESGRRALEVELGRELLVARLEVGGGALRRFARRRGDERHGLFRVLGELAGEKGLILADQRHDVGPAGASEVGRGHDDDPFPGESAVAPDLEEPRAGVRRSHGHPPPGAGNVEIRHVARASGELAEALVAQHVRADDAQRASPDLSPAGSFYLHAGPILAR